LQNCSLLISQIKEHEGQSTTFKKLLEQRAFKMLGAIKAKKYHYLVEVKQDVCRVILPGKRP
jgi:hypothetical protein